MEYRLFETLWGTDLQAYMDESQMYELCADGLILDEKDRLTTTGRGRYFLRNIAAMFDAYLVKHKGSQTFSQSV